MKGKGLLKKALSCVLSVAVACSGTVFVPQTAKAAGESLCPEVKVKQVVSPDPAIAKIYAAKYEKFRSLYPMLRDFYKTNP